MKSRISPAINQAPLKYHMSQLTISESLVADNVGAKDITFDYENPKIQSGFHVQAYDLLLFGRNYEYI